MKTIHRNKLVMFRTVMLVCDTPENAAAIQTVPAMATSYSDFVTKVVALEELAQPEKTAPSVAAKIEHRIKIEDLAHAMANVIHAYAKRSGNVELKTKTKFSRSSFQRGRDLVLVGQCRQIIACAHEFVTQLAPYNVSPQRIAAFETELENFEAAATKPHATRSSRMTRNAQIPVLVREIDLLLKDEIDRMMTEFRVSHAKFHDDYRHARLVFDTAATHGGGEPAPAPEPAQPPAAG